MADDDVRLLLRELASGDEQAAQALWDRYFTRLTKVARKHLNGLPLRVADEEDVALSVIRSVQHGLGDGRYADLKDQEDLWRLLVTVTRNKATDHVRRERAQKRGGGRVRGESVFRQPGRGGSVEGMGRVLGASPTPEFAAIMAETCRELFERLGDDTLRTIALSKMQGHSNEQIAKTLDCTKRTVERKLARIRERWRHVVDR